MVFNKGRVLLKIFGLLAIYGRMNIFKKNVKLILTAKSVKAMAIKLYVAKFLNMDLRNGDRNDKVEDLDDL